MDEITLKESIASLLKDKSKRESLAEMLVEYVQPNHITVDFVSMLLNARSLKPGDSLVKKIRKGIEVRTLVPGSIHLASEITTAERMNYVLDGLDVKVNWNTWDMENGEIGTVESIRAEMLAKYKDAVMNKVFTALTTVWTAVNTPNNFINVGGALTSTVLKNAIDYINQTTGGVKAVVGVRSILTPVTTFGGFWADPAAALHPVDPQLNEIMQTGWLGKYYGAPIVALNQIWDAPDTHATMLPTDKVLVIGNNVGEFITYGDVKWKMYDDPRPTPPYTFLEMYQQIGLILDKCEGIYVIGGLS